MARFMVDPQPTGDVKVALELLQDAKNKQEQSKISSQYQTKALEYLVFIEKYATTKEQKDQVKKLRDRVKVDPVFAKEFVEAAKKQ